MTKEALMTWFTSHQEEIFADYFALLRFPSIGADPAHLPDCLNCATWIQQFLEKLGFSVDLVQQDLTLPPVVVADRPVEGATHTVLVYGHYDVQPVDPVSL
ncbi:MAG: hypothetical protein RR417_06755, partial [Kiritimatiellia bacterium]